MVGRWWVRGVYEEKIIGVLCGDDGDGGHTLWVYGGYLGISGGQYCCLTIDNRGIDRRLYCMYSGIYGPRSVSSE